MAKAIVVIMLVVISFLVGHDWALTRLADDMHHGRTFIRDNGLVLEIRHRRILK